MIDTHSHIDGPEFSEDLAEVIQRAKDAGIERVFVPGICLKDTPHLLEICNANKGYLNPMIGLHPENILDEDYNQALDKLEEMLIQNLNGKDNSTSKVIAVGEVGLDLYWDDTHKEEQIEVFERQIKWAKTYDLPLMIHARNAHKELIEIMERHREENLRGVFHCFTGTEEEARDLLSFPNFMIGIGGVLTFKKSTLRDVVKNAIPLERIVLETDSPYMAPTPNRGKRNESAFVQFVALHLAKVFDTEITEIVHQTTENVAKVFNF